jgi:hypothetical protein
MLLPRRDVPTRHSPDALPLPPATKPSPFHDDELCGGVGREAYPTPSVQLALGRVEQFLQ